MPGLNHEYEAPRSFEAFVALARSLCGFHDLFVLSYDLRSLTPIANGEPVVRDRKVLDTILSCRPVEADGYRYVPLPVNRFPLLVGRTTATGTDEHADHDATAVSWAGLAVAHQSALFERVEQLRRPQKMAVAAQLQWDQLPVRAVAIEDYDIAATLEPATRVAGDMYDIALSPAGAPTLVAMDAMGHGVSATLAAALAMAAMRNSRRSGATLAEQARAADDALLAEFAGDRFVTMVAVELHPDRLVAVNAGHEPLRRGPGDDGFTTLQVAADPPLGLDGPTDYRTTELPPLDIEESLCLLSDGAPESRDAARAQLGEVGINDIIGAAHADSSLQAAHRIGQAVLDFCVDLDDDLTVVIARRLR